jgi:ParB family chromosome partitioning protein
MGDHPSRPISSIRVGARHRRDLGDVDGLAVSIAELGLLHPVVIKPDGALIAGERRLEACKKLGWADVPVTVVELDQIVRGEFAENANRKDFLPSEIDAIRRELEPLEKAAAKQRMTLGKKFPQGRPPGRRATRWEPSPGSRDAKSRRSLRSLKLRKKSQNSSATLSR